jgi:hypothetical protein
MPRNTDINQLANLFLNYSSFFEDSSEVHLQVEALIYNNNSIKALLFCIGPLFHVMNLFNSEI